MTNVLIRALSDAAVARMLSGHAADRRSGARDQAVSAGGRYSTRTNDQWRVCFVWTDAGPEEVEIVDDH